MAFYLVRADPKIDRLGELRDRLDHDEFIGMSSFGIALTKSLENARYDPDTGEAIWEEEDYCVPPLKMEREAVLDDHFEDITVETVDRGEGWTRINDLPSLWEVLPPKKA